MNDSKRGMAFVSIVVLLSSLSTAFSPAGDAPPPTPPPAPQAPPAVSDLEAFRAARESLAERDYAAAARMLEAFRKEFPASPLADDVELLLARATQLAGSPEAALASLQAFVEAKPGSPFSAKARLLMADAFISLKRFDEAASIYRARLEFLRGDAYRDRIAGYYLEIADPAYAGRPVQDPTTLAKREILQHDWAAAFEYYRKALAAMGTGKLHAERGAEIRYRIGRSLLELDRAPEAVAELRALIAGKGKPLPPALLGDALFDLSRAEWKVGLLREAAAGFARIEDELGDHPKAPEAVKSIGAIELALASEIPDERDRKAAFGRAIAAFDRFLAKFPQNVLAPEVAFQAAEALAGVGDRTAAIARFRSLIESHPRDERAPTARLRIAALLEEDRRFSEAVAERKKFLAEYPSDPRWQEAQEGIDRALYEEGLHLLKEGKKPEEARAAWALFLAERPMNPLAPEVYRRFHELALEAKKYAQAADALRTIVEKYPASPLAPSSALLLARLLEGPMDDLEGAIREHEALVAKYSGTPEAGASAAALAAMRGKHLALATPRTYRSGEPWTLKVETRNMEKVRFKAYRLNLEEYFRKRLAVEGIEDVAVGLVEPAKAWEHEVGIDEKGGYRPYKLFDGEKRLPLPEDELGATIVTAEAADLQASVLALRSDLGIVAKAAPRQTFVWAYDEKSGEPVAGARVLLADPSGVFFEGATGPDGVLAVEHKDPRPDVRVLAILSGAAKGAVHYATGKTAAAGEVAYGYTTKVHVTTDRPLYRPEGTVRFRAILRKVVEGRYGSSDGDKALFTITNPLGVILFQETLTANEFGAASGSVELTDEPPLGEYAIKAEYQGASFEAKFKVEEYRKPEFSVAVKAERAAYLRGEEVKGKVKAEYLFGGPVPRAKVTWRAFEGPWAFDASRFDENRWFFALDRKEKKERAVGGFKPVAEGEGETDAQGEMPFALRTSPDGRDHVYRIQIEATDLSRVTVTGSEDVLATSQGVYVVARADRKVYRPGDKVAVTFRTVDAASRPIDTQGEVVLARRVRGEAPGQFFDRPVETMPLATTGGKAEAVVSPKEPGEYRVLFRTKDRAGTVCEGGAIVRVAGEEPDLAKEARLLFEKAVYHQGEEARLFLNSPVAKRKVLLTFEGDRVIAHRVIGIDGKSAEIAVAMEAAYSPNIAAAVAIPGANVLHEAKDEAIVLQFLDVRLASDRAEYRPGEEAKIEVTALDQSGKPREAEFSLAVIDGAILQLQSDLVEPVKPFFYDQRRAHAVATASSNAFSYAGVTSRKPDELLAEEERRAAGAEKKDAVADGKPQGGVGTGAPKAPPVPATAAPARTADFFSARIDKSGGAGGFGFGANRRLTAKAAGKPAQGQAGQDKGFAEKSKGAPITNGAAAAPAEEAGEDRAANALTGAVVLSDEGVELRKMGIELEEAKEPKEITILSADPAAPAPVLPVEPAIRRRFADTAFWRSDVRTGKDGKASVTFTVPDNLTGWRAAAVGSTRAGEETLVGDGEARFRSKKGVLVRFQSPRFLTRDDAASLTTPVHNYLDEAIGVTVEMRAKDIEAKGFSKTAFKIGAGDIAAAEWEIAPGIAPTGVLTARALAEKESDAIETAIPVIPFGKRVRGGQGGLLADEAVYRFTLPEALVPGTARARIAVSPRFTDELKAAVLYLRTFPYGCVEQTVSGFVGAVAVAEAIEKLGTPDQGLRNEMNDLVPKRIVKLLNAQRSSGGWGWWGPSEASPEAKAGSDPIMTALALLGLEKARLAGFRVQEDRLEKARARSVTFLKAAADLRTGGLLAWALSFSKKAPPEELNRLWRGRDAAPASGLALLGLAMANSDMGVQAEEAGRLLAARMTDLILGGKVRGGTIPEKGARDNPPDGVLATAYTLMLLDRVDPTGAAGPRLYEGLLALRKGVHWGTTPSTAAAVMALAGRAAAEAKTGAEAEVSVEVNGEVLKTLRISPARPGDEAPWVDVPEAKLKAGENAVVLRKTGSGRLGYTVAFDAVAPADRIAEEGNLLKVRREYIAYAPPRIAIPDHENTPLPEEAPAEGEGIGAMDPALRIAGDEAAWLLAKEPPAPGFRILQAEKRPAVKPRRVEKTFSGDKFRAVLTVEARDDLEYVLIEDPIPAGCEVIDDPERFEGSFDRREVRDQKVVFFRSKLPKGVHVLSYLLRPTFPGRYHALPAMASLMYEPGIAGLSTDGRLAIGRPEAREPRPLPTHKGEERYPPPELTADEKLHALEGELQTAIGGPGGPGTAARLADLRARYVEVISSYPLADPYADLVLARIAGIDLREGPADRAVKSFEELRRRNPGLLTAEEDVWRAAAAYGASKEHEAEVVHLRSIFERRYRVDREVAATFESLGQGLRAQAYGFEVLAYYPDAGPVVADWFGLARRYAALKMREEDPRTKRPRERAMLRESAESLREFIAHFPASAHAPEAQLAVVTALESLEEWPGERQEAEAFERRYPKSHLLDGAIRKGLEADFRLGKYAEVLKAAPRLIDGEFLKADGKYGKSEHADAALYLVAKSHHVLGDLPKAIEAYGKLAAKIDDARQALAHLTARELEAPPLVDSPLGSKAEVEVSFRNVRKVLLRVYRVDLPVLFAVRKDLRGAGAVNLTGIDPVKAWEESLDGGPYPKKARIALPAAERGAYLVVGRAVDEKAAVPGATGAAMAVKEFSTVVIRTDLQAEVGRSGDRVRVNVYRRAADGSRKPEGGAVVRISSGGALRATGTTDARGVFEGPAPGGKASVLAEKEGSFALEEE